LTLADYLINLLIKITERKENEKRGSESGQAC